MDTQRPRSKPRSVVIAVNLLWMYMAISLVRMLTDFSYILEETKRASDIHGGLPPAARLMILIVGLGASAGLLVFFIIKISAGRNWARIVFLVTFIIGVPIGISQVSAEFARSPFVGTLSVAQFGLFGYALFLLFTEPGRRWFRGEPQFVAAFAIAGTPRMSADLFCSKCGGKNPATSSFCGHCGARLI